MILASADQVAIDAVAAKLMGIDPMSIKFIRLAHELGLGCGDPRDIEIVGDTEAAAENWHFDGPFKKMTFASRMQHQIYWGPMKKPIEWSLKTVLAPWAYIASVLYHDSFWYPVNAKRMMRDVLDSPWGRLFRNWETLHADADGYPARRRHDRRRSRRPASARFVRSLGILGTCIKEAPEFAPGAARRRRRNAEIDRESSRLICLISTFDPTPSTSSRSCGRSARGSARSAASTTPRRRSASWPTSSSRSSSIRAACAPICSSSSAASQGGEPPPPNYAFEDDHALRDAPRTASGGCGKLLSPHPEAVLQSEPAHPGAAHPVGAQHAATPRARSSTRCYYELIHNLVLELTRLGIEVKNLKMRVESMSSRLDFDERRARALEGVVQYRPGAARAAAAAGRRRSAVGPRRRRQRRAERRTRRRRRAAAAAAPASAATAGRTARPRANRGRPERRRRGADGPHAEPHRGGARRRTPRRDS